MTEDAFARALPDIAHDLRERRSTAVALVEHAVERHASRGGETAAYRHFDAERARREAQAADVAFDTKAELGPLQGIPVSVKDLYGVAGYATYAGSPKPLPPQWETEGPVVRTLRRQLGIVMGKTHTVEFAFGGIGTNPHWPTPRNPWDGDMHRVCGGSSSGAGVSLAEGTAWLALGTDTAGSVRIPASFTGQVGLKTSAGRWSIEGIVPLSTTLDTAGILTRTVRDAIYAFGALDPQWGDPTELGNALDALDVADLKLGLGDGFFWEQCEPGVAEGVRRAVDELVERGARVAEVILPEIAPAHELFTQGGPVAPELHAFLSERLPEWQQTLDANVAARVRAGASLTASEYLHRRQRLRDLARQVDERLHDVDVVVTPTTPITAPTVEEVGTDEGYRHYNMLALRNTHVVNYLSLCAISLPVGLDSRGLPVGMQLIARHGREEQLLAVARTIESALGTAHQRLGEPPLLS